VPTEDGLHLFIDCMYRLKEFYNLYLGKMGRAASQWLVGQSMPIKDRLSLFFNIAVSCLIITCVE
jgi:hypothetical protein